MQFNSTGFSLFGLTIRYYGLLIATGFALGIALAICRERRYGLPKDTVIDLSLYVVPAAIVGARLYYVVFSWSAYADNPISALYIWEGGLAIYGGILAGALTALVFAKVRHLPFLTLADLAAPSIALGQAIGRWGNFFNQEAYGRAVSAEWMKRFPIAVRIGADGLWHYATFFYESAWCLMIVAFLLIADRRGRPGQCLSGQCLFRRPGDMFFTYVLLYAVERALVEGLRTDSLYLGPVRVSQALSICAALVCGGILLVRHMKYDRH